MKVKNANLKRFDILGGGQASGDQESEAAVLKHWQQKLGYFSLFAGFTTIFGFQAQGAVAKEAEKPVPPRIAKRAAELVKKLNSACSTPDLLRLQSNYRLPSQKGTFNMLEVLTGADTCPGTAVPAGAYTVAAPFVDSGSTVGANDTVSYIQAGCSSYEQVVGPDNIYSFTLTARGSAPQIRATTTSTGYDMAIYVLNGNTGAMCPAGTGNDVTNCLTGTDSTLHGQPETISTLQMNALPLNTPLYLFIDSYYDAPGGNGGLPSGPYTVTMQDITVGGGVMPPANDAPVDINGDGKSDFTVLRNTGGGPSGQVTWFTSVSGGGPIPSRDWGIATDQFVPADFDGDGKDDYAVYRGSESTFYIVKSTNSTFYSQQFGQSGDDPTVVGDYTGDNIDDIAVYRSGANPGDQSFWFYYSPTAPGGFVSVAWGQNGDFPAPGDYDGDHKNDFVVQRADSNGVNGRFFKRMASGAQSSELFGLLGDVIVPGDYDGDGKTDLAVYRDNGGFLEWHFKPSATPATLDVVDTWGVTATDYVAQGDYDGDGKTDYAVYRPGSPGVFYMMTVGTRFITTTTWGGPSDIPAANYNVH